MPNWVGSYVEVKLHKDKLGFKYLVKSFGSSNNSVCLRRKKGHKRLTLVSESTSQSRDWVLTGPFTLFYSLIISRRVYSFWK